MLYALYVVPSIHKHAFDEVVDSVRWGLEQLGHETWVTSHDAHWRDRTDMRVIVFGGNCLWAHPGVQLPDDAIVYNLEQLYDGSPWLHDGYADLLRRHEVWDYSATNLFYLADSGINPEARLVPFAYAPVLERCPPAEEQPIDVLFYGYPNERRLKILDELWGAGLNLVHLANSYGAERDELISQSKVILNIHYYPVARFEPVRVGYALANRALVVSEVSVDQDEFQPLRPLCYVPASTRGIVSACQYLCQNPDYRRETAGYGYEAFRSMPVDQVLAHALEPLPR